jgi:hypothetical protein
MNIRGVTPEQLLEASRLTPDDGGMQAFVVNLAAVVRRDSGQ